MFMDLWTIIATLALLLATAAACWRLRGEEPGDIEPAAGIGAAALHFFGIGAVPMALALAVLTSTAAVATAVADILAHLHLGADYPVWFPLDALGCGLGAGLLCTRLLAAAYPRAR